MSNIDRTALLSMDYQNGIVASIPASASAIERTAEAIAVVRELGGHVGHVRVAFRDEDIAAMPESSAMAAMITPERRAAMHADAEGTAFDERVAPQDGDIVVRKTRVGAFSTTDLAERLREREVDTLVLTGIATSGVVLSTLRDAADRDFRLIVLADACADHDQEVHDLLTGRVFARQAKVLRSGELRAELGG